MHEDDEEADMRTQEELMMQHRYMMVRTPRHSLQHPACRCCKHVTEASQETQLFGMHCGSDS